jgi:tetratricopeptide (TPR) repeat protein
MALNNLGESLFLEEKFAESLVYSLQAMEMKVRIYGDDHPKIASTVVSLGSIYQAMGQMDQARRHFEKGLAIFHKAAGEDHPRTILTLSLLGRLHESMGAAGKARPYLERAIAARGDADRSVEQATDRFALVRVVAETRGRKQALAAATALQAELGEGEANEALAKALALWIAKHLGP